VAGRTLLLIIDVWATVRIAGTVSIISTKRNQRLGDLAAGTMVVRERRDLRLVATPDAVQFAVSGIDVTAVSASEVATVRDFLARRERLAPDARARVARTLADSLAGRIGGIEPGSLPPEGLLETVVGAKATGPGGAAGADTVPANPDHTAEAELDPRPRAGPRSDTSREHAHNFAGTDVSVRVLSL
jgi:hypothetical protein